MFYSRRSQAVSNCNLVSHARMVQCLSTGQHREVNIDVYLAVYTNITEQNIPISSFVDPLLLNKSGANKDLLQKKRLFYRLFTITAFLGEG